MNTFLRFIITALLVMLISNFLSGITVDSFMDAIWVALTLGVLRIFVKPVLVLLTLPFTLFTLGLFLFIINAVIIKMAGGILDGFRVDSLWSALIFSLLLSFGQSITHNIIKNDEK
jgi:putative membrane protein